MKGLQTTTYSMWSLFRNCRKACEWRYILGLKPIEKAHALYFGSLIHECLETWHRERDLSLVLDHIDRSCPDRAREEAQRRDWHLATAMMRGYAARYRASRDAGPSKRTRYEIFITGEDALRFSDGAPGDFSSRYKNVLWHENKLFRRVKSVTRIPYRGPVHNLEVEGDPSFIANGVLVHNCVKAKAISTAGLGFDFVAPEGVKESDPRNKAILQAFFNHPNDEQTWGEVLENVLTDFEALGKSFSTASAMAVVRKALEGSAEALSELSPWPAEDRERDDFYIKTGEDREYIKGKSTEWLQSKGMGQPPIHCGCRCVVLAKVA